MFLLRKIKAKVEPSINQKLEGVAGVRALTTSIEDRQQSGDWATGVKASF